ncbi:hypothetical protein KI387_022605, partial [Taxus chinensis]
MSRPSRMFDSPSQNRSHEGLGPGILVALDNKQSQAAIPRVKCGREEENGGKLGRCKPTDFDDSRPFRFEPANFLDACYLCRRRLSHEKDIYMYRGDEAFCSEECRYQKIMSDERKERCPSSVSSSHN